jgi:diacylglycerol kinase (ATP)
MTPTSEPDCRPSVAIVANPYSGARRNRRLVENLVTSLTRRSLTARVLWDPNERRKVLTDPDLENTTRCVVVVGGDGTIADVINEKPRHLPLAVLPAGNENLFARALGFPNESESLVAAIVAGRVKWIDLGRAGRRFFTLSGGCGL